MLTVQQNGILNAIHTKYKNNKGSLSVQQLMSPADYASVAGELFKLYPSIQVTFNSSSNGGKVLLVLGIV